MKTPRRTIARAFTLVELMVVIAIIGLLASVVAVNVMGQAEDAYDAACAADMQNIEDAVRLFKLETGAYPERLSDLWEQPADASDWGPDPYLHDYPPVDPWGNEYVYEYRGGSEFEIISYGADGAPGGQDERRDRSSRDVLRD